MKKILLTSLLFGVVSYATDYNVVVSKDYNNYNEGTPVPVIPEEPVVPPVAEYTSCNDILNDGASIGNGVYDITNNGKTYQAYCNMVHMGGGWTLIAAQYESNPIDWNEGIQSDYTPHPIGTKSFAFNTQEIPVHTESSFSNSQANGIGLNRSFPFVYSTGEIPVTSITNNVGEPHLIHRSSTSYYQGHDPELLNYTEVSHWRNTLAVDKDGGTHNSFSFSPGADTPALRGYGFNGAELYNVNDSYAWVIWVR